MQVRDDGYEARVRASFERQVLMATLGATLETVHPGEVVIALPFRADLTQQHGYLHASSPTATTPCSRTTTRCTRRA